MEQAWDWHEQIVDIPAHKSLPFQQEFMQEGFALQEHRQFQKDTQSALPILTHHLQPAEVIFTIFKTIPLIIACKSITELLDHETDW